MKNISPQFKFTYLLFLSSLLISCSKEINFDQKKPGDPALIITNPIINNTSPTVFKAVTEGFEGVNKTSYASASVSLSSGHWTLDDALIGTSSSDVKNENASARVRNSGKITMNFDITNDVDSISIKHARYGNDGNSSWELWVSTNSGQTWSPVGNSINTNSPSFSTESFFVNLKGNVRIEIRKTGGGTNRINLDDIIIYNTSATTTPTPGSSDHLAFGNPSNAITDIISSHNYLMLKDQYALSYHRDFGIPNWVAWHLDNSWLGTTPRQDDFRSDNTLPLSWYWIKTSDYTNSGFNRGHNIPSADRNASVADNSSTFLMTNIIPQSPDNNQGPWAALEDYCRTLVAQGNELYIYSGNYGEGGTGTSGYFTNIAAGKIKVPNRIWKVIVVLPNGTDDVNRVDLNTRIIAVDLPNIQGIRSVNWGDYRVSVKSIESITGLDLLSAINDSIESMLENRVDAGPTN